MRIPTKDGGLARTAEAYMESQRALQRDAYERGRALILPAFYTFVDHGDEVEVLARSEAPRSMRYPRCRYSEPDGDSPALGGPVRCSLLRGFCTHDPDFGRSCMARMERKP